MTNEVRELFDIISTNGMSVLWDYGGSRSASTPTQEPREWSLDKNGVIVSKPIPVYKCGTHDYETKSLTEFNQHIDSHNNSKAASTTTSTRPVNEVRELFNLHFG